MAALPQTLAASVSRTRANGVDEMATGNLRTFAEVIDGVASAGGRPARDAGDEFCVVDVETTGFSPRLGDRVIEIAAVRVRADGGVLDEWTTLLNPARDIGPTHIHGISAGDVVGAPEFREVMGDLLERLDGAVLVAHNLRFDWGFLSSECGRAGHPLPELPGLCTIALGHRVQPGSGSRRLVSRCADHGIRVTGAHEALNDARATAQLLIVYLGLARIAGLVGLEAIGCRPLAWPSGLPALVPCGRRHPRGARAVHLNAQGQYLARLVAQLDDHDAGDADVAGYLEVLDRALEDRRVTGDEASVLADTAREWGLSSATTLGAHARYFDALCGAAVADAIVTEAERADLNLVAHLLGLSSDRLDAGLEAAAGRGVPPVPSPRGLAGLSVCFTGALIGIVDGAPLTRAVAERLADDAGLRIAKNVSRGLDLLVVADPDTQSTKARRARELGTRVMAEQVFWHSLGLEIGPPGTPDAAERPASWRR